MTAVPRWRDSATFSAAWRQTEQRRKSASPSFHSFVFLSKVRGVEATVKFATAAPLGVKRSSGSAVRLPTTVMTVSPATEFSLDALPAVCGRCRCGCVRFRCALRIGEGLQLRYDEKLWYGWTSAARAG